jgi:ectoine hydroxylase
MQLTESQIAEYDERGYLFCPGLLDAQEAAALQAAMPEILARHGPEVIREKTDDSSARLVFGAHVYSEPFRRLSLLPRMLIPVRQLLRDDVYLHQSRMNPKEGFGGGGQWEWHQDYSAWRIVDEMREPRCIMASVFIDDCTTVNSPLLVIPGTQSHGMIDSVHLDKDADGYSLYDLDRETVGRLANENGIESLIGPAGSVCFVNTNVIHGSANNVSPWRRAIMYLIYNAVSNACTGGSREWHHHNRDFTPLEPIDDNSLRELAETQAG